MGSKVLNSSHCALLPLGSRRLRLHLPEQEWNSASLRKCRVTFIQVKWQAVNNSRTGASPESNYREKSAYWCLLTRGTKHKGKGHRTEETDTNSQTDRIYSEEINSQRSTSCHLAHRPTQGRQAGPFCFLGGLGSGWRAVGRDELLHTGSTGFQPGEECWGGVGNDTGCETELISWKKAGVTRTWKGWGLCPCSINNYSISPCF